MASPYLNRPIRTVEQVMAERLRRPVPVGSHPVRPRSEAETVETTQPKAVKSAEGGGD